MKQPFALALALFAVAATSLVASPSLAAAPKPDPKPESKTDSKAAVDPILKALWSSPPLTVSEDDLRKVGVADAARDVAFDYLLNRIEVVYDAEGRAKTTRHMVIRYRTREAVEQLGTIDVPYSPWFEDRPVVTGRVIPARGAGSAIDPKTIVEAAAKNPELIVSDRKNLAVPLPHLAVGSTVELLIAQNDHKSPYGSPVRNGFQGRDGSARATIVEISAPAASDVAMKALDTDATITRTEGKVAKGVVTMRAEMVGSGSRMAPADKKAHGVMWGVGGKLGGWAALSKRYLETLGPVLADATGWPVGNGTRTEKIGAIVDRLAKDLRYTGLHLGDAAIVPFAPKDTLARGYGDCKDLASLVVRALTDAGIPARVVLLHAGDQLAIDPDFPGLDLFDHAIAYVPADPADPVGSPALWLDATAPEFGVGALPGADLERNVLVVDAATTTLTPTPKRSAPEQADVFHVEVDYRPAPIGPGAITLKYTFGADQRYSARRMFGGQDPAASAGPTGIDKMRRWAAHSFAAQIASMTLDDADATRPVTLTLQLTDVRRLDSDGRTQKLDLSMDSVVDRLDQGLFNADRRSPFKLSRGVDFWMRYRVVPPAGYAPTELPKDVDAAFGPLHWKVSFTQGKDGVIEAFGRYEVPQLDFTAKEIGAVLDDQHKRADNEDFKLELQPAQAKLPALERAAWFRKELVARPKDAELRARWALELDKWDLSDEARKEVERAAKDLASTPAPLPAGLARFVLTARARLWERDAFGRVYKEGWDRKRAIGAWRAVLALDPKSVWARHELADILVRGDTGEYRPKRDKEGDEGRAMLEATAREGSDIGIDRILQAWDAIGDYAAIIKFAEAWTGPRDDSIDAKWAKAVALVEGPQAAATLIESWNEPRRIQGGIASVTSAFMLARRFDDASAVFDALSNLLGGAPNPLSEWTGKVKKLAPMEDYSTPDKAYQSFYSLLAQSPDDLGKRLGKLLGVEVSPDEADQMKRLLKAGGSGGLGGLFGEGPEARWAIYDVIFGLATLKSEGDDKIGWQTTLSMPQLGHPNDEPREFGKAYFAPVGTTAAGPKTVRLVGFAGGAGLPQEALDKLEKNDVEGARKWLGWAWDGARFKPKTLSEPDPATPVEALWRTGFLLTATSLHPDVERLATALDAGAKYLVGDERGLVLEALLRWSTTDAQRATLAAQIDRLFAERPPSPNERAVRARLLAFQGKKAEALALEAERLATNPNDAELITEMANIESLVGELDKARDRLHALRDTGGLEDAEHNELAWLDLCLDKVDAKTLESANRAAQNNAAAAVHTRALVEIDRGFLDLGALSMKRLVGDDDAVAPSVYLVLGRMAEALDLRALAATYYKKVTGEGEMAGPTSSQGVAQARLAKLGAGGK